MLSLPMKHGTPSSASIASIPPAMPPILFGIGLSIIMLDNPPLFFFIGLGTANTGLPALLLPAGFIYAHDRLFWNADARGGRRDAPPPCFAFQLCDSGRPPHDMTAGSVDVGAVVVVVVATTSCMGDAGGRERGDSEPTRS